MQSAMGNFHGHAIPGSLMIFLGLFYLLRSLQVSYFRGLRTRQFWISFEALSFSFYGYFPHANLALLESKHQDVFLPRPLGPAYAHDCACVGHASGIGAIGEFLDALIPNANFSESHLDHIHVTSALCVVGIIELLHLYKVLESTRSLSIFNSFLFHLSAKIVNIFAGCQCNKPHAVLLPTCNKHSLLFPLLVCTHSTLICLFYRSSLGLGDAGRPRVRGHALHR